MTEENKGPWLPTSEELKEYREPEEDQKIDEEAPEDPSSNYDRSRQRINLGIHPLGGILLDVVDAHGRNASIQLDQQMLSQIVLTLITMNVMLTQQEAAMKQAAIEGLPDLWTPHG